SPFSNASLPAATSAMAGGAVAAINRQQSPVTTREGTVLCLLPQSRMIAHMPLTRSGQLYSEGRRKENAFALGGACGRRGCPGSRLAQVEEQHRAGGFAGWRPADRL